MNRKLLHLRAIRKILARVSSARFWTWTWHLPTPTDPPIQGSSFIHPSIPLIVVIIFFLNQRLAHSFVRQISIDYRLDITGQKTRISWEGPIWNQTRNKSDRIMNPSNLRSVSIDLFPILTRGLDTKYFYDFVRSVRPSLYWWAM